MFYGDDIRIICVPAPDSPLTKVHWLTFDLRRFLYTLLAMAYACGAFSCSSVMSAYSSPICASEYIDHHKYEFI